MDPWVHPSGHACSRVVICAVVLLLHVFAHFINNLTPHNTPRGPYETAKSWHATLPRLSIGGMAAPRD